MEAVKPKLWADGSAAVVVSVQDGLQHSDSFSRILKQLYRCMLYVLVVRDELSSGLSVRTQALSPLVKTPATDHALRHAPSVAHSAAFIKEIL